MSLSEPQDPKTQEPPEGAEVIAPPGNESDMSVKPNYGEDTYVGSEKLKGRAVALAYAREGADVLIFYLNEDEGLAQEANKTGIRVNIVAPGLVWTPRPPALYPPRWSRG